MKSRFAALLVLLLILSPCMMTYGADSGTSQKQGDLVSLFKSTAVTTPVKGNVVSVFGNLDIKTPVTGDVTSIFGDIIINAKVTGRVTAILGNIKLGEKGSVSKNTVSIGSTRTAGNIHGDVLTVMGDLTVDGRVSGKMVDIFGSTMLTARALAEKDLFVIGTTQKAAGTRIFGNENTINIGFMAFTTTAVISLMSLFGIFVLFLGLPLLIVLRDRTDLIWNNIEKQSGRRILLGFLLSLAAMVIFILLAITVVIPLVYFILLVLAETTASIFLGRFLYNIRKSVTLSFAAGFLSITLVKGIVILLVPQMGLILGGALYLLFDLFVNSLGIGILADTRFGTQITAPAVMRTTK